MPSSLLRRKDVDACQRDAERSEHRLKRSLGVFNLTALGIGAIIGAGIFSADRHGGRGRRRPLAAGPALMVSFVLAALACGFAALCYAEFAAMVPVAGSAYTYAYVTLGELVAWIIGWDLILEYAVGNVAVAISWSGYFQALLAGFGWHLPDWLASTVDQARANPGCCATAPHLFGMPIVFNLPAVLIVALLTVLLVVGIQRAPGSTPRMVVLKLVMVLGFIGVGVVLRRAGQLARRSRPTGFNGILAGASLIFFAYIGFDAVSTTAEEAKNPQRDMPIGIIAVAGRSAPSSTSPSPRC